MERLSRANLELQMQLAAALEERSYWINQCMAARAQLQQAMPTP